MPTMNPLEGVIYPSPKRAARYFSTGSWIDTTVGDALRGTAEQHPDRLAFASDDRSISFRELDESTERLGAALLDLGLVPGDRAMFQLGTTVETVVVLLACYKAGIIPVCSLPQHREVEIGQLVQKSEAKAYFVQGDFGRHDLIVFAQGMMARWPSLNQLIAVRSQQDDLPTIARLIENTPLDRARSCLRGVPVGSQDVLSFQLSGGTTGVPKIIPRFHAEYLGHTRALMRRYEIDSDSRIVWSLPLLHNAGQVYALIPTVLCGCTTVLMSKVDIPRMLDIVERHRITHAISIGPIAPQLLAYAEIGRHDLSSLRLFATMSRADALEAHLGVRCSNLYGITEGLLMGSPAHASEFMRHRTQGCSGNSDDELLLLEPGTEHPVVGGTMGELCFRGPSSLTGYYRDPEATEKSLTREGYFRSGDMMTANWIGSEVCYTFEGRLRDNINRGGEKIGCEEVEGFVCRHPAVADAKLVAMPDPIYGEKGCVFIVARQGIAVPTVSELSAFLVSQGLAKYKSPERIELINVFPVTKVGKLDKSALKQMIIERIILENSGAP
jgi:non-ribosomal peptide synthetase component E (peptide arylation enzyme)